MKIYFYTFGCKVNQYETDNIRELFLDKGHTYTENYKEADVCVINSCTVTQQADSKCRQLLKKLRRELPETIIVLAGCFAQAFSDKVRAIEECDIIVGTDEKRRIPEFVDEYILNGERIISIKPHSRGEVFEPMINHGESGKTRAYIKIQDGCDRYCTYCMIPFARGHVRSKPISIIREEVAQLTASGYKEIVLTGINLCCYGEDLQDRCTLTDVVETACSIEGDFRVRLGSIEPEMISDDDISRLAKLNKLCPHFHLSLQSGCDAILKRMNRHYTSEEYAELCNKLREYFSDCSITTDIMVGFPGETEEEFTRSAEFVKSIGFSQTHIFPYSRRSGTKADTMPGQVAKKIKHDRALRMKEVCISMQYIYHKRMVGKTLRVLFERETDAEWYCGHADNYIVIKVRRYDKDHSLRRQFREVLILSAQEGFCVGEFV